MLEVQAKHPGRCNLPQSVSARGMKDTATAKKSVKKKMKEQHLYEDCEKNIEATMRSQSSAQRRKGEKL